MCVAASGTVHVALCVAVRVAVCIVVCVAVRVGKTGFTADRDKIEFRLFNSSSIFNVPLREELFSLLKQNQTMHSYPGFMALVT